MERKVTYGYVERTHGLKGRLVLKLFVMGPAVPLDEGSVLYIGEKPFTVTRSRKRDNERITVDCEGLFSREQADELRGETVTVDLDSVLKEGFPLPVHGFSGFTVLSGGMRFQVEEVRYNSTNPQLMVKGEKGLFPVPLNLALTGEVDPEQRTITVQLPEGLEEL
jgi:ribosomal 30S subunit maturation factor RimM